MHANVVHVHDARRGRESHVTWYAESKRGASEGLSGLALSRAAPPRGHDSRGRRASSPSAADIGTFALQSGQRTEPSVRPRRRAPSRCDFSQLDQHGAQCTCRHGSVRALSRRRMRHHRPAPGEAASSLSLQPSGRRPVEPAGSRQMPQVGARHAASASCASSARAWAISTPVKMAHSSARASSASAAETTTYPASSAPSSAVASPLPPAALGASSAAPE